MRDKVQIAQNSVQSQNWQVVYFHVCHTFNESDVAKAIEYMMLDFLLSANRHMHFAEDMKDPRRYVFLNDSLINRIEMSKEPVCHYPRVSISSILNCS